MDLQSLVIINKIIKSELYIYRRDINGVWLPNRRLGACGAVDTEGNGNSVAISNDYILTSSTSEKVYFYDGNNGLSECSSVIVITSIYRF